MSRAEAYRHAKFHIDPSNRLATVHERHRQTGQTDRQDRQRTDSIGRSVLQTVAQEGTARAPAPQLYRNGPLVFKSGAEGDIMYV